MSRQVSTVVVTAFYWIFFGSACDGRHPEATCPQRELLLAPPQVELAPTPEAALVRKADLVRILRQAVQATPQIRFARSPGCAKATPVLQVRLSRVPLSRGRVKCSVYLDLTLRPKEGPLATYRAVAERVLRERRPADALLAVYERAVRDLLRYPAVEFTLEHGDPEQVLAALVAGRPDPARARDIERARRSTGTQALAIQALFGPVATPALPVVRNLMEVVGPPLSQFERDVRETAIRTAGTHRLKEALPILLQLFRYVRAAPPKLLVLDAIVDIGDPSAVPMLTKLVPFDDPDELGPVVEAVARLGGPEARAFLELLADGHPDERIRTMARSALRRLRRGSGGGRGRPDPAPGR